MTLLVSPSPRDLVARLPDNEKIAIDLVLHQVERDPRFAKLVPDEGRRGYIKSLAALHRSINQPHDLTTRIAQLTDDERVAIDLVLLLNVEIDIDPRIVELVPSESRRGYLKTLASQYQALGVTIGESTKMDVEMAELTRRREAWQREWNEQQRLRDQERKDTETAREARDAALPPKARRAVQRHRRRLEKRFGKKGRR